MRTMHVLRSRVAFTAVVVVQLCLASAASAQAPNADALFDQGKKAMVSGDLDTACARFRASDQIDPAAGTRANLGECEDKRGKVASALEAFRGVLEKLPAGDSRIPVVKQRIKALEARLPRLTLRLAPGAPKDTTVRDGTVTIGSEATFGDALPIDPGVHHLVVGASSHSTRTIDVTVTEGKATSITIEPGPAETSPEEAPPASGPAPSSEASNSPGPWIVGGIGLAGLIVGGVTGALVLANKSTFYSNTHKCVTGKGTCVTPDGDAARSAINTLGPVTTVGLVVGGVGVAVGAIWLGVRPSAKSSARIGVSPVAGGAAWRVEGTW